MADNVYSTAQALRKPLSPEVVDPNAEAVVPYNPQLGEGVLLDAANSSGLAPTIYNGSGKTLNAEQEKIDWYDRNVTNEGFYSPDEGPEPFTALEQIQAFFETENTIGSYIAEEQADRTYDFDFDVTQKAEWQSYPELRHLMIHANNDNDLAAITNNHLRESRNREIIDQSSLMATLGYSTIAMSVDLPMLPAMVFTGGTAFLGRIGAKGTAALWAGTAGTSEIIAEAMKHDSQTLRTPEESLINIASATLLSGLIGAGAGTWAAKDMAKAKAAADQYAKEVFKKSPDGQPTVLTGRAAENENKSAGAAMVADRTYDWEAEILNPKDLELVNAAGLEKFGANPLVRLSKSRIPLARRLAVLLADSPYYYKGYAEGRSIAGVRGSVESQKRQFIAKHAIAMQKVNEIYLKDRGDSALKAATQDFIGQSEKHGKRPFREFQREVGQALRRGNDHPDLAVREAVNVVRNEILDPIMEQAIEAGVFNEGIRKFSERYFPRLYDFDKLRAESDDRIGGFTDKVYHWLQRQQTQAKMDLELQGSRLSHAEDQVAKAYADIDAAKRVALENGKTTDVYRELMRFDIDVNNPEQVRQLLGAKNRPKSLAAFVRENGGLSDPDGELAARNVGNESYVGIYSNNGHSEEHFIRKAVEDGYYDVLDYNEISLDRFRDDLANDVDGHKLYTADVRNSLLEVENMHQNPLFQHAIQDLGLSRKSTKGEIDAAIAKNLGRDTDEKTLKGLRKYAGEMENVASRTRDRIAAYEELAEMTPRQLRDVAMRTKENIIGLNKDQFNENILPDTSAFRAGNIKDRKLTIDDLEIEDYLIDDLDDVTDFYVKSVSPQVIVAREFGDIHMSGAFERLNAQYQQLRGDVERKILDGGGNTKELTKELQKIDKEQRDNVRDITALRDKLYGQYNRPNDPNSFWMRASHFIRAFNYMRMLGGMTIAAIPDLARAPMTQGFKPVMDTMFALRGNKELRTAAIDELKAAGVALDTISINMTNRYSDVTEFSGARTKFDRGVETASNVFSRLTFMPQWNDALKGFSGLTVQNAMAKAILSGNPTKRQIRELAKQGISGESIDHLRMYLQKYGKDGDLYLPNTEKWESELLPFKKKVKRPDGSIEEITVNQRVDGEAMRNMWRSAVGKTVNEIIVTPGIGEMPLWMSTPLAQVVMQFKSFPVSAHNRILMSGLQARDKQALGGLLFAVGLGAIVNEVRAAQAGRDTPDNAGDLIFDAMDRGGVLGWLNEPIQAASMLSRGALSPNQLWGSDQARVSRYQSRNILGAFLGPSADLLGDISSVSGAISTGEWSEGDVSAARKLLPAQNLFYFVWLLKSIEE